MQRIPALACPTSQAETCSKLAPKSELYLMHRVASENQLVVEEGTIFIQEAGQLGGLIGRSVTVGSYLDGFAVSNNMLRFRANDGRMPASFSRSFRPKKVSP